MITEKALGQEWETSRHLTPEIKNKKRTGHGANL